MSLERFRHYTVGIPEIDAEHWELCTLLNEAAKYARGKDYQSLKELVTTLSKKLKEHFANEETAMVEKGYPWLKPHREDHQRMISAMDKFLAKTTDVGYTSTFFCADLEDLFVDHIDQQDRQYEHFLAG